MQLERLAVGQYFNPEIGYVQRGNMRRSYGQFRFSPRPRRFRTVRRFSSIGRTSFTFGQQRMLSGTVTAERGSFYGGEKTAIGAAGVASG